ncbi:MAG: hypothetical protein JW790_05915 [Dehalococcoidales bacterium]|nr:hypothetical protein [Dehalococcoidales bacterium]
MFEGDVMDDKESARLRALLSYWIEHSREHSQEFKDWAGRAEAAGQLKAARELSEAAQEMDMAAGSLSRALKDLAQEEP